jgi:hypothetical protein
MSDLSTPLSLPVKRLQREIKRVARHIHKSGSLDELDRAWATLCRLNDALALAMERGKAAAD